MRTLAIAALVCLVAASPSYAQAERARGWLAELSLLENAAPAGSAASRQAGVAAVRKDVDDWLALNPRAAVDLPGSPDRAWTVDELREQVVLLRKAIETLLRDHELDHDVVGLFDVLEAGVRNREHAKFVFTRSLSDALSLFASLGAEHGFSVEEMSFADIACIRRLYGGSEATADVLAESIAHGRSRYRMTRQLLLPPLMTDAAQWAFISPRRSRTSSPRRKPWGPCARRFVGQPRRQHHPAAQRRPGID